MHRIGLDTEFSDTIKVEKLWKDTKTEYVGIWQGWFRNISRFIRYNDLESILVELKNRGFSFADFL